MLSPLSNGRIYAVKGSLPWTGHGALSVSEEVPRGLQTFRGYANRTDMSRAIAISAQAVLWALIRWPPKWFAVCGSVSADSADSGAAHADRLISRGWPQASIDIYEASPNATQRKSFYSVITTFAGCMQIAQPTLADSSSVCICYLTTLTGGTAYTVNYASRMGLQVINIAESINLCKPLYAKTSGLSM